MAERLTIWQWLADTLASQDGAVLMLVADSEGSSPCKAGTKMAVDCRGRRFGTLGGGAFEAGLIEKARALMTAARAAPVLCEFRHDLAGSREASGMVCGGRQTVLLYRCGSAELPICQRLAELERNRTPGLIRLTPSGLYLESRRLSPRQTQFDRYPENDWQYQEEVGSGKQAYLIGGGHVSLALSKILATLEFEITVIDERDQLETLALNNDAQCKLVMPYWELDRIIPEGERVFVLIMTHSHETDEQVAGLLAAKRIRYLGVLGSNGKIARLKANLAERLPAETLRRIHGPIGLPIHSHTPAEIAVSVAAELIQILNTPP